MSQKMKKSLLAVGYRLLNQTTEDTPHWLVSTEAGGREYTADPRGEMTAVYADGKKVYCDNANDGYDINLTLLAVIDDVNEKWLNEVKDTGGRAEYADGKEFPYFELYLVEDTTDGVGKTTIYYNCQCSNRPSISGKTKEGSGAFDFQFPVYPIAATPRESDNLVKYEVDGKTRFTIVPEPDESETSSSQAPTGGEA